MRNITKSDAPKFWLKLIKKNPHLRYTELEPHYKQQKTLLKETILRGEQFYLCCYCCKIIDESCSHIEHFRSRDRCPQLEMKYENMLISCSGNTCGMKKGNQDFSSSMTYSSWEHRFEYSVDGHILPRADDSEAGEAIDILNLNDRILVQLRRAVYDECIRYAKWAGKDYIKETYIDMTDGHLPRFPKMVEYFYNRGDFDADVVDASYR